MSAYIIKSCISMVLLFGLYWFFLRKEKLLIFNRYFLIFSMVLSLTIPFISLPVNLGQDITTSDLFTIINTPQAFNPPRNEVAPEEQRIVPPGVNFATSATPFVEERNNNLPRILLYIYFSGFTMMLIRFCRNILIVNHMFKKSEKIDHQWYRIALLAHPVNPFSFLRTVFINKKDYLENRIAENVLRHELEHVRQSHSRDIIFFELLHIIFWFNPVLFLYKWAARINHEYLADEAVIRTFSDMKTYADELINFISNRVGVPFTSGFSPSMIRLRLLMLNTNTTLWGKSTRMLLTLITSVLLMSFLSITPAKTDSQNRKNKKEINKDIVIKDVYFRGPDFSPLKALVIIDGRKLSTDEKFFVDIRQIKTIDVLKDRKATRKYGRSAKNGAVVITTYDTDKKSAPDSLKFKPIYTINDTVPKKGINIDISNLYSFSLWTYPIFPNQDLEKRWRTIELMTRDYYQIRGKVIQKNGEPLPGALLTVSDNPAKVITDKDGRFFVQDVKSGSVGELSAEGFDPIVFKIRGGVFRSDLAVTLYKSNEPRHGLILTNKLIEDFSGTWRFIDKNGKFSFAYYIHQYDSDSINIRRTTIAEDGKEYKSNFSLVFNTVKTVNKFNNENMNYQLICAIDNGQSFSTTTLFHSKIGLFKEQKSTQSYSLSVDGKQMIIRHYYSNDGVSTSQQPFEEVYERITN